MLYSYLKADPTMDLNLSGVILDLFCLVLGVLVASSRGVMADTPDLGIKLDELNLNLDLNLNLNDQVDTFHFPKGMNLIIY